MPQYICKKCGATGHSKNIATRTFFPDNQLEAMLSHMLKIEPAPEHLFTATWTDPEKKQNGGEMILRFFPDGYNEMSYRERMEAIGMHFYEFCKSFTDESYTEHCKKYHGASKLDTIKQWACEHEYEAQGKVEC